ncbi:glucodextranase DOMON-like domain-containing protein [Candidatus Bipolaricaulota sp. J31]
MRTAVAAIVAMAALFTGAWAKGPLNLAIIWHQHQPLYWNRMTGEYELPWVRVHAVQEYIDSPRILLEFPGIHVTYNLQPTLLRQLLDYAEITEEERAKGGLYRYIGAVDNHLKWTWKLIADPGSLTPEERREMQRQFFWINGYMFDDDGDDPYYDPRYAALNALKNVRDLTDQELLDAAGLYLLWQISPELHEELGVADLRGKAGWTSEDVIRVIEAQRKACVMVVDAYRKVQETGTELITSPYFHPIVPILLERGWDEDVQAQLELAVKLHTRLFGEKPIGVWPPEQAVSSATVAAFAEAGFSWTVTNEGILGNALGHTPRLDELTTPWDYGGIAVLFRHHGLSDKIGFSYGNKPTQVAVADFMGELKRIWNALPEPEKHLLVVALDGENWMFMAGYPNNGRSFLRALYAALSEADWVRTVTPREFLAENPPTRALATVPRGSWGGDLSTWEGEVEEEIAWDWLSACRGAVFSHDPNPAALDALYAAEGSDWFFWYGKDWDSGTDELFDWLFKVHLVSAYRSAGVPEEEIPAVLFLKLEPYLSANLGEVKLALDGVGDEAEWADAARFPGSGEVNTLYVGYSEKFIVIRVDLAQPAREYIGTDAKLILYTTGAPGEPANISSRYAGATLGMALASAVELDLAKVRRDGSGYVFRYAADGKGSWRLASPIKTLLFRKAKVGDVVEFQIPMEELGTEPGKTIAFAVALERPGELLGEAPARPVVALIPTLIKGELIFAMEDPKGDDFGPGPYVYPLNKVFAPEGIFDLVRYAVYDAGDSWQFALDFAALPNPWNGPHGFSHPLVLLFLDVEDGGSTKLHPEAEAAKVSFDPEHPWDYFIRVAGWPAYGRHLWTPEAGPELVSVTSDPKRGRIIVTVPKSILPEVRGFHYVLVASQDGYAKNYVRPIAARPGEWVGGGCSDPQWAPQIYDYLAPTAEEQKEMLSGYVPGERYAILLPVEVK